MRRIKRWPEVRQLSLDAYLRGWQQGQHEWLSAWHRWAEQRESVPLAPEPGASRWQWQAYWQNREQWDRNRGPDLESMRDQAAVHAAVYDGVPCWTKLRRLVYLRDRGICFGCGTEVPWEAYELGHLVDRMCGGLDLPCNVAVMCHGCNYGAKELCHTLAEAEAWRKGGGWLGVWERAARKYLTRATVDDMRETAASLDALGTSPEPC